MSRDIDSYGRFSAYASAIKGNNCHVPGQATMIATAGGAGLVCMCVLLLRAQNIRVSGCVTRWAYTHCRLKRTLLSRDGTRR
jgi:hypothetical protein